VQVVGQWQKDTFEEIPQGQGQPLGAWSILAGSVAVSKLMELDFDLEPAVRISSECVHPFLTDLF
jgi:hypothetical protein